MQTFSWAVYLLDRCGAASTGFSAGLLDDDIITPFPRPLADIASVSSHSLWLGARLLMEFRRAL